MFILAGVLNELCKDVYKSKVLFEFIPYPLSTIIANFMSLFLLNYLGTSFMVLTVESGLRFYRSTYYIVPIIIFGGFFIFRFGNVPKIAQKKIAAKAA